MILLSIPTPIVFILAWVGSLVLAITFVICIGLLSNRISFRRRQRRQGRAINKEAVIIPFKERPLIHYDTSRN
jgi:hypothetical protein